MIRVSVSSNLRKRLLGEGNIYFYHARGGDSQGWQWARGRQTALQEAGKLGVLQVLQNELANLLEEYLYAMRERARRIFETDRFRYTASQGGKFVTYTVSTKKVFKSPKPISENFFSGVTKRGKLIMGSFGNSSDHASYVEWGTGPVGKANVKNISRRTTDLYRVPKYTMRPWVYFNEQVGHFVRTKGMPPRPFVYPAFLALKKSFKTDCKAIIKGLHRAYFLQNAAVEASFVYEEE